ncbi:MAG: bifunctional homocysteine S-methyltransferase/methylenetetrahydrofolate reductase [Candidatus Hinthialibacter antarcticus]|nr:bifunctional homocysteine S-methyltransferase/methylenetetrahydrofolate reductase [Candidatus Hinthialibacter antarcticus]
MPEPILTALQDRVILADGGMSMQIYQQGFFVNRCYDQLNLISPDVISGIHQGFVKAGADLLTANTFGANRPALSGFGLADQLEEINKRGVELAREAAGDGLYVAGSIGPVSQKVDKDERLAAYAEHAAALHKAGADLLVLDTFLCFDELERAFKAVCEAAPDVVVLPSIHLDSIKGEDGWQAAAVQRVAGWGAKLFGVHGGDAQEIAEASSKLTAAAGKEIKVSLMPSLGGCREVEGRMLYMASPEYMAEYLRRCVQRGAGMIGGNAGVDAAMIKESASFLRSIQPRQRVVVVESKEIKTAEESMTPLTVEERSPFGALLGKKFAVSVEIDLPKGLDPRKSIEGAKFLYENGIDAVNIADGPRASGRMAPAALAQLVREECGIEPIVHVCCRDRNLLALQMDLISDHTLGLRNLMLITGDPPKMGIYPDATAVFDLDAIGLIQGVNLLNHGLDFAKRPLKGQTQFVLGMGCNPGAADLDKEVERFKSKVDAGADFVFSQPVYDPELLNVFLKRIEHVRPIPFFVGILPLASYKNAEFLHTQVPGMQIPDPIRERMRKGGTKEAQRSEGIAIAAEALREAKKYSQIKGAYVFPPFGRYAAILDVLEKAGVR